MKRRVSEVSEKVSNWWSTFNSTSLTIYAFILVYGIVNFALAAEYWERMKLVNNEFWFLLAKACGQLLNFNCALILLPMCRQFMRLIHAIPGVSSIVNVDRNIALHKHVGRIIAILGTVHTFAHYMRVAPPLNLICGECCSSPLPQVVPDFMTTVSYGIAQLSGSNVVPPVPASSSGTLAIVLSATSPIADSFVSFNISTSSLSGEVTSMLFQAAPAGANTDAFLFDAKPFFVADTGSSVGRFPSSLLTASTFRLLMDGGIYLNVRTSSFPKGELRAQVSLTTPSVDATCDALQPTTCNVPAWWTRCAGLTGILVSVVMLVMFSVAADSIRPLKYEFFFNTHHLFVLFYLFLGFHGPNFWKWTCGPAILYTIERAYRCALRWPYCAVSFSSRDIRFQVLLLTLSLQNYDGQRHFWLFVAGLPAHWARAQTLPFHALFRSWACTSLERNSSTKQGNISF
jgi:hypothetical protein